ncbi:MAG: cation:proton antiporter [archaeon GB-1867-035]|nr:cation:proton antiporter [Candidatus Culexmicrobium profundum]
MEATIFAFYTVALIMLIGFFGMLFFRKTSIPDVIFLLLFGVVLGPITHVIDIEAIYGVLPYMAMFAISILLFDSGLRINIDRLLEKGKTVIGTSILSFILSLTVITLFLKYMLYLRWAYSLMLGSILAVSGSMTLITLIRQMPVKEEALLTLTLEMALTNVLSIIIALSCLEYINLKIVPIGRILVMLTSKFSTGILIGLIVGVIWLVVIYMLREEEYFYMFTLSVLIGAYSLAETLGGSGALASLIFGLVLGNDEKIASVMGLKIKIEELRPIRDLTKRFHSEITFLMRSFFFVLLGLTYFFGDVTEIVFGAIITGLLSISRFIAISIVTIKGTLASERKILTCALGRGLVTAVLGIMPMQFSLKYSELMLGLVVNIIFFSNILMAITLSTIREYRLWRKKLEGIVKEEEKPQTNSGS